MKRFLLIIFTFIW